MTSFVARYRRFSQNFRDACAPFGNHPRDADERLQFYFYYLRDVVPHGIIVHDVIYAPAVGANASSQNLKREIQLKTVSGRIFMLGLVSNVSNHLHNIEKSAGNKAYTQWKDGKFADDNEKWRFFTGTRSLRFFGCKDGEDWQLETEHSPIGYAVEIAAYLQEEYNNLAHKE